MRRNHKNRPSAPRPQPSQIVEILQLGDFLAGHIQRNDMRPT